MSRRIPQFSRSWRFLMGGAGLAVAVVALAQAGGTKLVMNGSVASTSVRVIDGRPYAPVADMAKALNMTVVKRADGYEITRAGGANQVEGLNGKVGDVLFDGRWRFSVLEVKPVESYTMTSPDTEPVGGNDIAATMSYDNRTHVLTPKPGYRLLAIRCRIINGRTTNQNFWTGSDVHNALTDAEGEAWPPVAYDYVGAPIQTKPLLPGSKIDFSIIFAVPEKANVKDLVFTLKANNSSEKPNDVRVALPADLLKQP